MFMNIPLRSSGSAVTHIFIQKQCITGNSKMHSVTLLDIFKTSNFKKKTFLNFDDVIKKYSMALSNTVKNVKIFVIQKL